MSENLTADGIQDFIEKYKNARNFNSKEIRFTIAEADRLNTGIAQLLNRYRVLSDRVIDLQEQLIAEPDEIELTGGNFS